MTDDTKVSVTTTFYRDESGEARIQVTCGSTILSDQPNPYFFVDTGEMKPWVEVNTSEWPPYPWEKEAARQ